jgi:hypothetical protein
VGRGRTCGMNWKACEFIQTWSENPIRSDFLEHVFIDGMILKSVTKEFDGKFWSEFIRLRIEISSGLT